MRNEKFIITIGRQRGSGGRKIGKELARRFHIPYYDREILTQAAEELEIDEQFLSSMDEKAVSLFSEIYPAPYINASSFNYLPTSAELIGVQTRLIREFAARSSCVIVGRCADYFLSDFPNCFNIFLHSDLKDRIINAAQTYHISQEEARRQINKIDRERARYYKNCTGNNWGDTSNYDLSINTSRCGIEPAANLIEFYIRQAMAEKPEPQAEQAPPEQAEEK